MTFMLRTISVFYIVIPTGKYAVTTFGVAPVSVHLAAIWPLNLHSNRCEVAGVAKVALPGNVTLT